MLQPIKIVFSSEVVYIM